MVRIIRFEFPDERHRKLAFSIRNEVFVSEQGVAPELEYDEFEPSSHHYIAFTDELPIATARWRETSTGVKLERFAVLKKFRRKGFGAKILKSVLTDVIPTGQKIYLHSQISAVDFYERNGFEKEGCEFIEAGIRHYKMFYRKQA